MSEESVKAIYYWPQHADLTLLKEAFAEVKPPFQVKPYAWQPGHPGPVLVLSSHFPYIVDYANASTKEYAIAALKWALGLQKFDKGPHLMEDNLKEIFGEETTEVTDDTRHVRFEHAE